MISPLKPRDPENRNHGCLQFALYFLLPRRGAYGRNGCTDPKAKGDKAGAGGGCAEHLSAYPPAAGAAWNVGKIYPICPNIAPYFLVASSLRGDADIASSLDARRRSVLCRGNGGFDGSLSERCPRNLSCHAFLRSQADKNVPAGFMSKGPR